MFDFLGPTNRIRNTRLLLLAIIVLTIPCYCLGAVMLAYAPDNGGDATAVPTNPTLGGMTQQPLLSPTWTPFATWTRTPTQAGAPVGSTPFQLYLPTNTPVYIPPTSTSAPTWTPYPTFTLTLAPTLTLPPSNTPLPTSTPAPTNTPVPPNTPAPTLTPQPTVAPQPADPPPPPTDIPPPTQEVIED